MSISAAADFNVEYVPCFFEQSKADQLLEELKKINYFTPCFKIKNKNVQAKRKVAAFGDEGVSYSFSGTAITASPWTPLLLEIRDQVERHMGCTYNYVLLNFYANGQDCISQHRDDESSLDETFPIPVLSFGETRSIEFKRAKHDTKTLELQHGSLYIMHNPTNIFYTHGIPADSSKTNVRISLSFRHILMPVATKKVKMQDALPDDDWLSQFYSKTVIPQNENSHQVIAQWALGFNTFVNIVHSKDCMRIHIRRYNELLLPTKNGVVMTINTWSEFTEKLTFFNFNDCITCNKQLLMIPVSSEKCILQQMFDSKVSGFYLKTSFLKLNKDQILKLTDLIPEINQNLIQIQMTQFLPALILRKSKICHSHFESEEKARQFLLSCIENEIQICLNNVYPCAGCLLNDPSQFNHDCIMHSFYQKFNIYREKIYLSLNVHNIVKHLQDKCLCYFNENFLSRLDLCYLETYFQTCSK